MIIIIVIYLNIIIWEHIEHLHYNVHDVSTIHNLFTRESYYVILHKIVVVYVFEDCCCVTVCMRVRRDLLAALFARQTRPLNYANPRNICILYTVYFDDTTLNPFNNRAYTRRHYFMCYLQTVKSCNKISRIYNIHIE